MKVCFISDTHGLHEKIKIPECDILIHSGDATNLGTYGEFDRFLTWFSIQKATYHIYIAGNHDLGLADERRKTILEEMISLDIIYLENSGTIINEIKIYGSPITPKFYDWAFMKDRGEPLKTHWESIPENLDILVTHGPPYGILDLNRQGKHCGCEELLEAIKIKKPYIHAFGHLHENKQQLKVGNTLFINSAIVSDNHKVINKPVIIDI